MRIGIALAAALALSSPAFLGADVLEDAAWDIAVEPGGDFFVSGRFSGTVQFGDDQKTSLGGSDGYLARYSADGELRWIVVIGAEGDDECLSIELAADGAIVLMGVVEGVVDLGADDASLRIEGADDEPVQFLARYSPDGTPLWMRTLGKLGRIGVSGFSERGTSTVDIDPAGNIYVVGSHSGAAAGDAKGGEKRANVFVGFAKKFDEQGTALWSERLGLENETVFPLTVTAAAQGCVVGGHSLITDGGGIPSMYLQVLKDDGRLDWSRRWSGKSIQTGTYRGAPEMFRSTGRIRGIAINKKGDLSVVGSIRGEIDFDKEKRTKGDTRVAEGESDLGFVLQLGASGKYQGITPVRMTGPGKLSGQSGTGAVPRHIEIGDDGSIFIAGIRRSRQMIDGKEWSFSVAFVQKLRKGRPAWTRLWDAKNPAMHSRGSAVAITADGGVLLSGAGVVREAKDILLAIGKGLILQYSKSGKPVRKKK